MILVGADLATASGFCFGRPDRTPIVRAYRAPVTGDDYGAWGVYWIKSIRGLLEDVARVRQPDEAIVVNYEAPLLPHPRYDPVKRVMVGQTSIQTTRKLQSLGVLLETVVDLMRDEGGIPIEAFECNLKTLKKELTGRGDATKADMVHVARRCGIALPDGKEAEDCADAFAAWLRAMRQVAREHQPLWDRRIYSRASGALV